MIDSRSLDPAASAAEIRSLIDDAKRAATPGVLGGAVDRPTDVSVGWFRPNESRLVPNPSPLSVAIEGPGLFALERDGHREYGRLGEFRVDVRGMLTDAAGRRVLGFRVNAAGQRTSGLIPIQVAPDAVASRRFSSYDIDARGLFAGSVTRIDARSGRATKSSIPIARVALAVFRAPERLALASPTTLRATAASGPPTVCAPGDANVGLLRQHALETGLASLEDDLKHAWLASRRAELQTALAAASDDCLRTALGLVK